MNKKLSKINIQTNGIEIKKELRAKFLQEIFTLSDADIANIQQRYPLLITLTEKNVQDKNDFYLKELNLTQPQINKIVKASPSILSISIENAKAKMEFFQKEFGCNRACFAKMLRFAPTLLSNGIDTIKNKTKFYMDEFGLNEAEFKKMLRALPNLFSYGLDMVKDKAKFYQENFNLSKEEISLLIKSMPGILSFSLDSVLRKIDFFQEEFNFTKTELSFLLKKLPVILALSTDSVKQKAMQIKECKFTKDDILKIPTILTVPENNLKLRYLVLRQVATREEILAKKGSFMMNQEKAFARIAYLKNKYGKVNLNQIMRSEKAFVKVFKITSQEVMNKYKLTTEAVDQIQDKLYHEEIEPFNAIENAFIESEYGKTC